MRHICTSIVATLVLAGTTLAATINVPADYTTIQAAVDAASDGDEIIVAPGTYTGSSAVVVNMLGKAITLRASGAPEETIIHGQGARRVITCSGGEGADTAIEGFTITGGSATSSSGGGIFFAGGSSPTITGCTISNNTATADGGGIFCDSYSSPTMTGCVISNNIATRGGGLFCETSQHLGSPPTLISCTISNNTAQYGGGLGVWGTLTLNDCLVWLNTAANDGGGVWLIGSDNTTISGCTISANTASVRGGGVYHYSAGTDSSPTITACTISGNTASTGGGVYRYDSIGSLTLTDTVVCGNDPDQIFGDWADGGGNLVADECEGGAMSWTVDDDGPADFDNIQAAINAASSGSVILVEPGTYTGTGDEVVNTLGKAITIKASGTPEATIIHGQGARRVITCSGGEGADTAIEGFTITGGSATSSSGGGIFFAGGSSPTITGCTISNNTATADGGGIFCDSYSSPTMTGCVISNNIATRGGGLFCETSQHLGSPPTLISCTISNNTAQYGGGLGVWGTLTLNDCLVWLNTAANDGGGVWLIGSDNTTIINCTITGNRSTVRGGGVYHYSAGTDSSPAITDCTISGNTASTGGGVYRYDSIGSLTLTDTVVCGNDPDQIVGDWADGGGNLVADECEGGMSWTVDDDGPAYFHTIQDAVNAASNGDEVIVSPGTYTGTGDEVVNTLGKAITIKASGTPEQTIIAGDQSAYQTRIITCSSGEGADTIIEGFTITGVREETEWISGGIFCNSSSPTIINCTITGNRSSAACPGCGGSAGGGIVCMDSDPTITGCTISDNFVHTTYGPVSPAFGGGIYCSNSSPTISDCVISNNTVAEGWPFYSASGGGIFCSGSSSPTITGCTISGNSSRGVYCSSSSSPTITGCTISDNGAALEGGGIYCRDSSPTITDCTISGNTATGMADHNNRQIYGTASGIHCIGGSPTISGCEISNNTVDGDVDVGGGGGMICEGSSPTITDCTISGNIIGGDLPGGGILCESGTPTIIGSKVCANSPDQIVGNWADGGGNTVADECPDDCTGDLDGNGVVGVDDLLALLASYQTNADGDCDGDGDTDVDDLLLLISAWGVCP